MEANAKQRAMLRPNTVSIFNKRSLQFEFQLAVALFAMTYLMLHEGGILGVGTVEVMCRSGLLVLVALSLALVSFLSRARTLCFFLQLAILFTCSVGLAPKTMHAAAVVTAISVAGYGVSPWSLLAITKYRSESSVRPMSVSLIVIHCLLLPLQLVGAGMAADADFATARGNTKKLIFWVLGSVACGVMSYLCFYVEDLTTDPQNTSARLRIRLLLGLELFLALVSFGLNIAAVYGPDDISGGGKYLTASAHPLSQRGKQAIFFALVNQDGDCALVVAARKGSPDLVRICLDFDGDANLNIKDKDGRSALHWAAEEGFAHVVKILVDANANLDLVDKNDSMSALHWAAWKGSTDMVQMLVGANAKLDLVGKDGWSTLHFAALKGSADVVKILVAANANLDLVGKDGRSALHFSAEEGFADVVKILVAANANLDLVNEDGWSALHFAALKGSASVVKILVAANANLDLVEEEYGRSALLIAAKYGFADVVKVLVGANANLDLVDKLYGASALHFPAFKGSADMVKILLDANAKLDQLEMMGKSPRDWAIKYKKGDWAEVVELLDARAAKNASVEGTEDGDMAEKVE